MATMTRLLHCSDLHLDYPFAGDAGRRQQRRADQLRTFERIVSLAIKSEVDLLLVAGNLFASPRPDRQLVDRVRRELQRLVDRGIVPVILPGGSDGIPTPDNVYRLVQFPGVLLHDVGRMSRPVSIEVGKEAIHLYGYVRVGREEVGGTSSMRRRDLPGHHIGLLQTCLDEGPHFKELPRVDAAELVGLKLDYVALGNRCQWQPVESGGRLLAVAPGSPEGTGFSETGPRHCALVTFAGKGAAAEPVKVNSRRLERLSIDMDGLSAAELTARIEALADPELLLQVVLAGNPGFLCAAEAIAERFRDDFFLIEIENRCDLLHSDFAERLLKQGGLPGSVTRQARSLAEEADGEDELSLLQSALAEVLRRTGETEEVS